MSGANGTLGTGRSFDPSLKATNRTPAMLLAFSERLLLAVYLGFRRSGCTLGFIMCRLWRRELLGEIKL